AARPISTAGLVDSRTGRVHARARSRRRTQRPRPALVVVLLGSLRSDQCGGFRGHRGATRAQATHRLPGFGPRQTGASTDLAGRIAGTGRHPPLAVFVGKLTTATAAWDAGHGWLALIVMLNSVLSLFYYLRWIGPAFA